MTNDLFPLEAAISQRRSCRHFIDGFISKAAFERLLWAGQGATGSPNGRTAPSAHSLHPLRLLVAIGNVDSYDTGLFEVATGSNNLTPVSKRDVRDDLEKSAIDDQPWLREAACVITVCADFVAPAKEFSEQPPYGERGSRYVYIEAGAAAQNIALQAVAEELGCVLVAGFSDEATADALGLKLPYRPILHLCLGAPSRE